jgi:hypothetical protein
MSVGVNCPSCNAELPLSLNLSVTAGLRPDERRPTHYEAPTVCRGCGAYLLATADIVWAS